ncbi:uncharacterized protein EI90DRAFT_3063868 [Cantharellus anzutake]|uniref:uncharacterized protein n=1 Tax=Cantharellus anzutake TaxID=1750568 RepID=UPI001902CD46|nr:uncharacterized protein EI90DRAFT_3063868 [Cantharellus anzutake]KAF8328876.1 hypothetical protein EI90DRAFT_3063868 [Cantharellus anzutake]
MLELKWIPAHELTRDIKRQSMFIMNRDCKIIDRLLREHGPFPLLSEFNVTFLFDAENLNGHRTNGCPQLQRLEGTPQGSSKGWALRVSRKENLMGLHPREEIKAANEAYHQPGVGPVSWSSGGYIGSLTPAATLFTPACLPTMSVSLFPEG